MKSIFVALVLSLGALGCGSEDKSPQEQCEDLLSLICDRAVKCVPGAAGQHEQCFQALKDISGCERVQTASASYDTCLDTIESRTCPALFGNSTSTNIEVLLPQQCSTVVDLEN